MKRLYVIESIRNVVIAVARTKKKAAFEERKARRKGIKARIVVYHFIDDALVELKK